jgi:DNA topoisomerase IA
VIGYNIVRHIYKIEQPEKITRAYFNALTENELERAFNNLVPMDEALLSQGIARNLADVIIGLNLTKAVTILFKKKYAKLTQAISMGRVQSPLLSAIKRSVGVSYNEEAETEEPEEPKLKVYLVTDKEDIEVPISLNSEKVELLEYKEESEEQTQATHFPNTSETQSELPFNPEISMSICEALYLKGYATYPRTKSHYLPEEEIQKLEDKMKEYDFMPENFSAEYAKVPIEESKLPHWAITLTEEGLEALARGAIKGREKIVADYLITKIAKAMAPPLRVVVRYAIFDVNGRKQRVKWSEDCENPEDCVTPYILFSVRPTIEEGTYETKAIRIKDNDLEIKTEAFKPVFAVFTNKDLVEWMAKSGLGTDATRHTFPVILRSRNYIDKANLPNQLGETVAVIIDSLGLSTELTAKMESRIDAVTSLSDVEDFKAWIIRVTQNLLAKLDTNITFRCPKDHEAILINTRFGLFLRCEECEKFYSL